MNNVIPFRKPNANEKFKGSSLCRDGFHKWTIVTNQTFDVKLGKLVTAFECTRCKKRKTKAL